MYTCGFRINANLVKEGSFRINTKLVKEERQNSVLIAFVFDQRRNLRAGAFDQNVKNAGHDMKMLTSLWLDSRPSFADQELGLDLYASTDPEKGGGGASPRATSYTALVHSHTCIHVYILRHIQHNNVGTWLV